MQKFIVVLLFALSPLCHATTKLNINLLSRHYIDAPEGVEVNERNLGIGIEKDMAHYYIGAGFYKNTYGDTTAYVGIGRELISSKYFHAGFEIGLASGYSGHPIDTIFIGDIAIVGDLFISIGRNHRIKIISTTTFAGLAYQKTF